MPDAGARATVVVASTDPTVCEVLARVVEAGGHEALRISDGAQVSGAVLSAPADGVVLDLGATNAEQLRALRTGGSDRGESVRAVVLSTGPANSLLAWQSGADAVLTRPFDAADLQAALRSVLDRSDADRRAERQRQIAAAS